RDGDPAVRLAPDALGADLAVLDERHVDDAPLDGRHRLQLNDLAGLQDPLRRAVGDIAQLLLPAAAVVLDVHRYAVVLALFLGDDEVDDVLEAGELLAAGADHEHPVTTRHR